MKNLIIAPWGSPKGPKGGWRWKKAQYLQGDGSHILTARSSLAPLTKIALKGGYRPSIIIIVPDTLYTSTDAPTPRDYMELLGKTERWLRSCLKEMAEETEIKAIEEAEIAILPGIGIFKNDEREYIFKANLSDFRSLAYIKILGKMIKEKPDEIWIDLTHGINYSTTLTYRSTLDALESYAIYRGLEEKKLRGMLKVFNSDPYNAREEGQELTIHEIRGVSIKKINLPKVKELTNIRRISNLLKIKIKGERAREIAKEIRKLLKIQDENLNEIIKEILIIVGSMSKGIMPSLNIMINVEKINGIEKMIYEISESLFDILKRFTEIKTNGNLMEVNRMVEVKIELINLAKSICLASYISNEVKMREWVTLSELNELIERMSKWLPEMVVTLSQNEYGEIARKTLKKISEDEDLKDEIVRGVQLSRIIYGEEPFNKRNFLAHAGLERTITRIRMREKPRGEEVGIAMRKLEVTYTEEGREKAYKTLIDP